MAEPVPKLPEDQNTVIKLKVVDQDNNDLKQELDNTETPVIEPFPEIDQIFHSWLSKFTGGVSPTAIGLAYTDWLAHLFLSPGKQLELFTNALEKAGEMCSYKTKCEAGEKPEPYIEPLPQDRRFREKEWQNYPFNVFHQSFLATQQWMQSAVDGVKGINKHHRDIVSFTNRQFIDAFSPSNFLPTNPVVIKETIEDSGANLVQGAEHFCDDLLHVLSWQLPEHLQPFKVGEDLAVTKGKVIFRNRLIELIQYKPTTKKVYAEPILIMPAWIMKYYILDLSPGKSLVEYLVSKGHTVFMISWKNPTEEDRNLDMEDYLKLGFMEALKAVTTIIPDKKVHAVGYCLGGTLLSIAAAWLAREGENFLKTMTLFAAQTDFQEAGELTLFIDESQLAFVEDIMREQGYLDKYQIKGIFQMLRSNDLIWSRIVDHYLRGERTEVNDLMAWSADATRMPYKMQSEYLRKLFLNDDLAEGRFKIADKVVALTNIKVPIFTVGTERDHVAPWKSVYKIHLLTDTDVTFVLTSGGHNVGIVSELDHPKRYYHIKQTGRDESYTGPEKWLQKSDKHDGSWWPAWQKWLVEQSDKEKVTAPSVGASKKEYKPLYDAPGTYVLEE